ncbi:hypothetical protein LLH23_05865 [bacterium]|nr:hypothetical protein [bacterium]
MNEAYATALRQDAAAWEALQALAQEHRAAIMAHEARRVDDLRRHLREALGRALETHREALHRKPPVADPECADLERQAERAWLTARDAIRLNLALLRDTCDYLEGVTAAGRSGVARPGHGRGRRPRVVAVSADRKVA